MWEDDANKNDYKWIIHLQKGLASRCWKNPCLGHAGGTVLVGEEVCGTVISVCLQVNILSIHNKTSSDQETTT
jgi:hypothetical protein